MKTQILAALIAAAALAAAAATADDAPKTGAPEAAAKTERTQPAPRETGGVLGRLLSFDIRPDADAKDWKTERTARRDRFEQPDRAGR